MVPCRSFSYQLVQEIITHVRLSSFRVTHIGHMQCFSFLLLWSRAAFLLTSGNRQCSASMIQNDAKTTKSFVIHSQSHLYFKNFLSTKNKGLAQPRTWLTQCAVDKEKVCFCYTVVVLSMFK